MRYLVVPFLALNAIAGLSGCSRHREEEGDGKVSVSIRHGGSAQDALGEGDVRITDTKGGVDLALIGDTISSGLSQETLAKVRRETDTSRVQGTGFGPSIERLVKGTVQSAIGTRVAFPVSAVKDVRYEGGRIVFEWNGKPQRIFDHTKVNDRDMLASFKPEDAQRFVDAVKARMRQGENF
jgi:hypothetical protein